MDRPQVSAVPLQAIRLFAEPDDQTKDVRKDTARDGCDSGPVFVPLPATVDKGSTVRGEGVGVTYLVIVVLRKALTRPGTALRPYSDQEEAFA